MNVINFEAAVDAHVDREYARWSELAGECAESIRGAMQDPRFASHAVTLITMLARLQAFDDLRLKAAGYPPQPLQDILARERILFPEEIADIKKRNEEARH